MTMTDMNSYDKHRFLHPSYPYHGQFSMNSLMFNANLQEFSQRVGYISALETGGKLAPDEAYRQVKHLWKDLKRSYQQLGLEE